MGSTDDETGGAEERANQPLFHQMSNTARKCIFTGDRGEREREEGEDGRATEAHTERERERRVELGVENDTEIHSSGTAQTHCSLTPYWDTLYTIPQLLYQLVKRQAAVTRRSVQNALSR